MANSNSLFLNDPNLEDHEDLIDNSEFGRYFNLKHFLFRLGVEING